MLAELVLRLATPAGSMTRRLGLVSESVAIWSRGLRQRKAWAPHHDRCRQAVATVVAALPRRRKAVVLGSGLLRDVPLDLLCDRFQHVVLIDIVHLPQIRLRLALRRNVTLITRDLGGVMDWLAGVHAARREPLADLIADETVDLVISANLLSQLAWPITDWLEENSKRAQAFPPDLPARAIAGHLDDLRRFGCRVVLLSDVGMVERDRGGVVLDRMNLLQDIRLPPPDLAWDWTVAPFGEAARDRETVHQAGAWLDFGKRDD